MSGQPNYAALFNAAVLDLAAIAENLGVPPEEGGAVPIIEAIEDLRRLNAAAPDLLNALHGLVVVVEKHIPYSAAGPLAQARTVIAKAQGEA